MGGAIFVNLVTFVGYALRLGFVVGLLAPAFALCGLALDVVDGALARRLGAVTGYGREHDYLSDAAIAVLSAWKIGGSCPVAGALALLVAPALQAGFRARDVRVSGSSLLLLSAIVWSPS